MTDEFDIDVSPSETLATGDIASLDEAVYALSEAGWDVEGLAYVERDADGLRVELQARRGDDP